MKALIILTLLTSSFSHAQLFSKRAAARSGGMGNGGHPYEMEFKRAGRQILNILEDDTVEKHESLKNINLYLLGLNIENSTIEIAPERKVLKDKFGRIKGALNFPGKKLIQINPTQWEGVRTKTKLKLPFVLHELLGLSGEEIDHYRISSKLTQAIKSFSKTLIRKIDLGSERGKKYLEKDDTIRSMGEITGNNIKYYFAFENSFGLRPYQMDRLDILCQNLGYSFYIDAKLEVSHHLLKSLETQNGGVKLSKNVNVTKKLKSLVCGK